MGEKHGLGNFRKPPGHPMPELASLQPPQLCGQSPILPMVRALKHSWSQSVSLVAQSCPTLCDSLDCSTPAFPIHHQLPEPAQAHVHQIGYVTPFSSRLQSFPASGSFPKSQFFASGGQSIQTYGPSNSLVVSGVLPCFKAPTTQSLLTGPCLEDSFFAH